MGSLEPKKPDTGISVTSFPAFCICDCVYTLPNIIIEEKDPKQLIN